MKTRIPFVAGFCLAAFLAACQSSPAAIQPSDRQTAEQTVSVRNLRADFEALYRGLQQAHFDLYARTPKLVYDRLYQDTLAELDHPMALLDAERQFQRFVAAGKVAHARIDHLLPAFGAYRADGGKAFPLTVRLIDGQIFLSENLSGESSLSAGDEILEINGISASDLLRRLRAHVSADTDYLAASLMELDMAALLWLELGPVPEFELSVRRASGAADKVRVPAATRAQMQAAAVQPALKIDVTERVAKMYPGAIAYLRPGLFMNLDEGADPYDPAAFIAFIEKAFADFRTSGAQSLLIDLRDNPGGHNAFSDPIIAHFADKPFRFYKSFRIRASAEAIAANAARLSAGEPGRAVSQQLADAYAKAAHSGAVVELSGTLVEPRPGARLEGSVFVLVNRRSYSNSVAVAALVQDYGFGRIIGEPTSDLATTHGAMEQFTLPKSGIKVGYPKAYIVRPSGDLRPAGVTPDIAIRTPVFEGADDPVLTEALRAVSQ